MGFIKKIFGKKVDPDEILRSIDKLIMQFDSKRNINAATIATVSNAIAEKLAEVPIEQRDLIAMKVADKFESVLAIKRRWIRETENEIRKMFKEVDMYTKQGKKPPQTTVKLIQDKHVTAKLFRIDELTFERLKNEYVNLIRTGRTEDIIVKNAEIINRVIELRKEKVKSMILGFEDAFLADSEKALKDIRGEYVEEEKAEKVEVSGELDKIRQEYL